MEKKIFLASLLVLSVLLAGCIGQTPMKTAPNDGIIITSFSSDPVEAEENEVVTFTLDLENQGGVDATNVLAELLQVEMTWRDATTGNLITTQPSKWGTVTLKAPRPQYNEPGDTKTAQWSFKTPSVPPGLISDYPVKARVTYDYKTTGELHIPAIARSFYRTEYMAKGKEAPSATDTNTNAPVKILISDISRRPIIVDDSTEGDATQTFTYKFVLKNIGSGFPITENVAGRITGTITLLGGFIFEECLGVTNTDTVPITADNVDLTKLRVMSGEAPISCTISAAKAAFATTTQREAVIQFNLDYRYYVEKEVSVKVFSR